MFKPQAESSSDRASGDRLIDDTWKPVSQTAVSEFLTRLRQLGLKIASEEGKLRVSAPPGALTEELRDELSRRKSEILHFLQNARSLSDQATLVLRRVPRDRPLELSFAQQRLWIIDQVSPSGSIYNLGFLARLEGTLSMAALEGAISGLVRRHEAFRTSFPILDGRPVQAVAASSPPDLQLIDLGRRGSLEEREAEALRLAREESQRPYDLSVGPLVRWRLYAISEGLHIFMVGMHHIITDGWSLRVIYNEFAEFYAAGVEGRPPSLRDLSFQYADFAACQRSWLSGRVLQRLLDYWRAHLAGAAALELPSDRPHAGQIGGRAMMARISVRGTCFDAIKRLTSEEGTTLFMTMLAGFQTLLHRYTGQDDIAVGSPIANRNHLEIEGIVGFFVNTLVLRSDLSGDPSFRELLRRVREVTLKAYEFQDLPFEKLVEELSPDRDLGRNPLFQVMFVLQNLPPRKPLEAGNLKISRMPTQASTSRFEIEIHLWEAASGLEGQLIYDADRFEASRIDQMVSHYQRILEVACSEPARRLSQLELLTSEEKDRLIDIWNRTTTDFPSGKCIHEQFEEQVQKRPDTDAVFAEGKIITYGELNKSANQLAAFLRTRAVQAGTRVGICMDRSIEMICAALAVLKVGGAYVPLDPSYPKERIHFMIKDASLRAVLTVEALQEATSASGVETIVVDREWSSLERFSAENVRQPASAGDLAYVIYTSGSTGTPKGVAVAHRAVMRLVLNTNYIELSPTDRVAHLSNVCFDAATFEIWGSLLNGASIVVVSRETVLEPELFVAELRRHQVTTMFLTTALFNELAALDGKSFQGMKQVLFGGEAVNARWVAHVHESGGPPERLLHVYGPTECTTFSTFYEVGALPKHARTIPIGRPISNTTAYVLDRYGHPVPPGIPGELYLGGPGVAEGYLNRPELTRERFIEDPFGLNGRRLYRTGDIVTWLPDGNIEFLGRADNQVKVRGFRIELDEVEVVLKQHPEVADVAVVAREDEPGQRQLVAYIVPRGGPAENWRSFLQNKLPAYMVPAAFVELETLPLTPSGKVDRLALPKPQPQFNNSHQGELSATEKVVRSAWARVLHLEDPGVEASFFELGGHSLLAIQVILDLRRILHIDLPVIALFEHPTVRSLSSYIDGVVAQDVPTVRPPIERASRAQPLPLSFAQERLWRNERLSQSPDNINVIILDIKGVLNVRNLERTFEEVIRRHEVFRTTFHVQGDAPVQRIAPPGPFKLRIVDLSESSESWTEALSLARKEKTEPFDFERGPLMRFSLLRLGPEHHWVVMRLHHILYDRWSLPVLRNEIDLLYTSFCQGEESPLTELPFQLADFAVWQRRYLDSNSGAFRTQLAYWKEQLSGELPILKLPSERSSELKTASVHDAQVPFEIGEELSRDLRSLTKREGTTLFLTFLTTLKALINLSTGQNDVMLGTYMAKRSAPECEGMMGCFSDLGVLRTRVASDLSFLELLSRVRETVLNAQVHDDMPFEMVNDELRRCGQAAPDVRAIFTFEAFAERPLRLGDLRVSSVSIAAPVMPWRFQMRVREGKGKFSGLAKFDVRLHHPHLVRIMMWNYVRLLERVVRTPAAPLCEVEEALTRR
jgi:amino acid adenylation domain-containing protein